LLAALNINVGEYDARAFPCDGNGNGASDAGGSTGNESALPCQHSSFHIAPQVKAEADCTRLALPLPRMPGHVAFGAIERA
jgi:hypothetical protein